MKLVDLNSLNGGVVLGAIQAGCEVLFATNVTDTFRTNLPDINVGFLKNTSSIPRSDAATLTLEDDTDLEAIFRIIAVIQPRFILVFAKEPSLGVTFKNYTTYGDDILNFSSFDTPQNRQIRILVLTRQDVIRKSMYFPTPEEGPPVLIDSFIETMTEFLPNEEQLKILAKADYNTKMNVRFGPRIVGRGQTCPKLCKSFESIYIQDSEKIRRPTPTELNSFMGFQPNFKLESKDTKSFFSEISPKVASVIVKELADWI